VAAHPDVTLIRCPLLTDTALGALHASTSTAPSSTLTSVAPSPSTKMTRCVPRMVMVAVGVTSLTFSLFFNSPL
jgi:hypothetical protein